MDDSFGSIAEISTRIHAFVREHLVPADYAGDDPLAEVAIDSLGLEQLLDHLEESYRILFEPEDTSRVNLSSVPRAARCVYERLTATRAGQHSW